MTEEEIQLLLDSIQDHKARRFVEQMVKVKFGQLKQRVAANEKRWKLLATIQRIGARLEPQPEPQEEIGEVIRRAVKAGDQEALDLLHSGRLNEKGRSSDRAGVI